MNPQSDSKPQFADTIMRSESENSLVDALAENAKRRPPAEAGELLRAEPAARAAAALLRLNPSFVSQILDAMDADARQAIFTSGPQDHARQWQLNLLAPEGSVGRMTEPAIGVFPPELSVGEAIETLRKLVKTSFITYGYVTDTNGILLGIFTMRDLLFAEHDLPLSMVMLKDVFSLLPELPLEEAMKSVLNRHYPVYPVCDAAGRLTGLVRGQAMFEERAFEITAQVGSMVGVEKEERLSTPWLTSLKYRHPWLQVNLLTCFIAAAVVGIFQDTIERLAILALFLPVLAGQSGNTGCQALAVTLRGMTLGELKPGRARALVAKEASLGLANGLMVGISAGIGMIVVANMQGLSSPYMLGFVVVLAMIGSCVMSGLSGALVPLTLKRLGFDPATASSIFLTTATDVVSMGLLLGFATVLVR